MDQELIAYLDQRFGETSRQIESVRAETTQQIASFREETNRRFEQVDEAIRHTGVTVEDLRDDVRQVAEGLSSLSERVTSVEENLKQEMERRSKEFTALLRQSYSELAHRTDRLEEWRATLERNPT